MPATVFAQGGFQAAWRKGRKTHLWIGDYLGFDANRGRFQSREDCDKKLGRFVTLHPNIWLPKADLSPDLSCAQLEPLLVAEARGRRGFDEHFPTMLKLRNFGDFFSCVSLIDSV